MSAQLGWGGEDKIFKIFEPHAEALSHYSHVPVRESKPGYQAIQYLVYGHAQSSVDLINYNKTKTPFSKPYLLLM